GVKAMSYVSWVGLRGAVPIIFATYPVAAGIDGGGQIFNIVFFVTLLSLVVQGTTVVSSARRLRLIDSNADDDVDFGVEIPDELPTSLSTLRLTSAHLTAGDTLRHIELPAGALVMMVRRGDRYLVPNGRLQLREGDTLLIIRESSTKEA
ncbi:MAG: TrkA C-terminal domain-containing protein, partial [Muribaculaceae bacterium]